MTAATQTVLTDPVPALLNLLAALGVIAAMTLASLWLSAFLWRERMLRRVTAQFPEQADELRRTARKQPLLFRRGARPPTDPYARTHRVVVPPYGDGRPGESFWAPGAAVPNDHGLGPDGSRQDVRVLLAERTHLLVVCLGRIGPTEPERLPAFERVHSAREHQDDRLNANLLGPVDRVDSAMGVGWRTTMVLRSGAMVTDTHVDRDGWAFVVGVLSRANHTRSVEALDHVLSTWQWIPAEAGSGTERRTG